MAVACDATMGSIVHANQLDDFAKPPGRLVQCSLSMAASRSHAAQPIRYSIKEVATADFGHQAFKPIHLGSPLVPNVVDKKCNVLLVDAT